MRYRSPRISWIPPELLSADADYVGRYNAEPFPRTSQLPDHRMAPICLPALIYLLCPSRRKLSNHG